MQALVKADFLLMFFSLFLASSSGLTIIDNLGQICQSLGYDNPHIFVCICNFLGRVAGGYLSELVVRKYAYPRPVAMAAVQVVRHAHFSTMPQDGAFILEPQPWKSYISNRQVSEVASTNFKNFEIFPNIFQEILLDKLNASHIKFLTTEDDLVSAMKGSFECHCRPSN